MTRPPAPPPDATLEGTLARVVFERPETGWRVVQLDVPNQPPATVVGILSGLTPGEPVRLEGRWVDDPRFGRQFQAASFVPVRPGTVAGIEKYLGSGLVDGLGPALAERLVAKFGADTLDVIERTPERLTEVDGIGPVRRDRIQKAWGEATHLRQGMVFFASHGLGTAQARRVLERYGAQAVQKVRANPYQLALDVTGIGFLTADRIATSLGLATDAPERLEAGVLHALGVAADDGHTVLPQDDLLERASALLKQPPDRLATIVPRLALQGHLVTSPPGVALTPLYEAERRLAQDILRLLNADARPLDVDPAQAVAAYERQAGLTLADAQRTAIETAITAKVLVITGGPGTGKTTLVNGILATFRAAGRAVALAAPTGRAAKRMSETTGVEARTLHRLLEYTPQDDAFARNAENPLEADLFVVDETSMVDVPLGAALTEAVPSGARLVLVGDVDQLPSVGPGAVLGDLIASRRVPVVRLDRIFRQAHESLIVQNAHRINAGELPTLPPPGDKDADFYFVERDAPQDVLQTLETVVTERIPKAFGLDPVRQVQVLTPMHRGLLGAQSLNERLQARLNPGGGGLARGPAELRVGDKVMQTRNDYDLGVFNGDVGRVQSVSSQDRSAVVRFDEREVPYDRQALDQLVLAYACSIHKSQGSEYPAVVLPVSTQHFVMLHRNLLYTAVTRARRLVVLVGSRRALRIAVESVRDQQRNTYLGLHLRDG